ncbi:hypothetical protein NC651_007837 [Populus alba x Populus x berolinensis]|nr:hypothetical protein NC651_007837 [Populus alba x Populus x berolinensis]
MFDLPKTLFLVELEIDGNFLLVRKSTENFFGSSAQHYIFDVFILGINRCKIVVSNVFKNVPENNLDILLGPSGAVAALDIHYSSKRHFTFDGSLVIVLVWYSIVLICQISIHCRWVWYFET